VKKMETSQTIWISASGNIEVRIIKEGIKYTIDTSGYNHMNRVKIIYGNKKFEDYLSLMKRLGFTQIK
jgi:hypothetical protein